MKTGFVSWNPLLKCLTHRLWCFGKSSLKSRITGNILRPPFHVASSSITLLKVLCILFFFLEFDPWKIINLNPSSFRNVPRNIFSSCSNVSSTSLLSLFQLCSHEKLQKAKILPAEGCNIWWSLHHDHNCWSRWKLFPNTSIDQWLTCIFCSKEQLYAPKKSLLYLLKSEPFRMLGSEARIFQIFENKLSGHKTEEIGTQENFHAQSFHYVVV